MPYKFPSDAMSARPLPKLNTAALGALAGSCAERILRGSAEEEKALYALAVGFGSAPDPIATGVFEASKFGRREIPAMPMSGWEAFSRVFNALPVPSSSDAKGFDVGAARSTSWPSASWLRDPAVRGLCRYSFR